MSVTIDKKKNIVGLQFFASSDQGDHFKLEPKFIEIYEATSPNFGFNGLGEFTFYRTYSRVKKDGFKESFLDTLVRVVEGCYEIQRRHCKRIHIPWDYVKSAPLSGFQGTRIPRKAGKNANRLIIDAAEC